MLRPTSFACGTSRFAGVLALAATLGATSGCFMAGNYQTARTLPKGQSEFALNFAMTEVQVAAPSSSSTSNTGSTGKSSIALPEIIPELAYHIGVSNNVEVGGRVALNALGVTGDVKWRIVHAGDFHLALDPEVGYQALFIFKATSGRLNLIGTMDVADNFSLNAAVFGSATHITGVDGSDFGSDLSSNVTLTSTGASLGVQLRGETFFATPSVEWDDYLLRGSTGWSQPFQTFSIVVSFGWISGREMQKLNEMDQKLDRMQNTLDQRLPPPQAPYGQQPQPGPSLPPGAEPPPPPIPPQ